MNVRQFMPHGIVIRNSSLPPLFTSINGKLLSLSPGRIAIWRDPALHRLHPEQVWKVSPVKE